MRSQADQKRYVIDVSKTWHVTWWAAQLGVPVEVLLDAIDQVGNESDAVEEYLSVCMEPEQQH